MLHQKATGRDMATPTEIVIALAFFTTPIIVAWFLFWDCIAGSRIITAPFRAVWWMLCCPARFTRKVNAWRATRRAAKIEKIEKEKAAAAAARAAEDRLLAEMAAEEYEPMGTLAEVGDVVRMFKSDDISRAHLRTIAFITEGAVKAFGRKLISEDRVYTHDCCFDGRGGSRIYARVLKRKLAVRQAPQLDEPEVQKQRDMIPYRPGGAPCVSGAKVEVTPEGQLLVEQVPGVIHSFDLANMANRLNVIEGRLNQERPEMALGLQTPFSYDPRKPVQCDNQRGPIIGDVFEDTQSGECLIVVTIEADAITGGRDSVYTYIRLHPKGDLTEGWLKGLRRFTWDQWLAMSLVYRRNMQGVPLKFMEHADVVAYLAAQQRGSHQKNHPLVGGVFKLSDGKIILVAAIETRAGRDPVIWIHSRLSYQGSLSEGWGKDTWPMTQATWLAHSMEYLDKIPEENLHFTT